MNDFAVVITSINRPTEAIERISMASKEKGFDFIVVGDLKSPNNFHFENCLFYSIADQLASEYEFAHKCPTGHYARKNLGYLLAISRGCKFIVETDDDNIPFESFFHSRSPKLLVKKICQDGWLNVYRYFTDSLIWPRGLPLDKVNDSVPELDEVSMQEVFCPIQQGLADDNPDVDAIYRLILPLPICFDKSLKVALGRGVWCPFNSQNTTWFPEAYPLLYLPAYCSFRMTDIFRSFVAQTIAWENDWFVLFHEPTVYQNRNEHDLMKDFKDEVVGYLNNSQICHMLSNLSLKAGKDYIPENMLICYEELVKLGVVGEDEMKLLQAWLNDLNKVCN